ncbi:transposable element Tcb1 transposase [Trichonephila clavipes]|nr:transposable element Tcb1 transposase [Trichonephila clavipes]
MTRISLIQIDGYLNVGRYISDILHSVIVPYRRGVPNTFYQQDNTRPHVACHVLTFLDTQGIRLLPWFPDLSPIENNWLWIEERLTHHLSPANTVDEVRH